MKEIIIDFVGLIFIWAGVYSYRSGKSEVTKSFERWFVVTAVVIIGILILKRQWS